MKRLSAGLAVVATVILLSAFALWASLEPQPATPTADQWDAARALIAGDYRKGDAVRIFPPWLREAAADLGAPAGHDEAMPDFDLTVPPDPMFAARYERLWVVTALDRPGPAAPDGAELELEETLDGGLTVQRYLLAASPIEVDLMERLPKARVERWVGDGKRRQCRWRGDKHDCRGKHWENVRVVHQEVAGSPRRCILLHPYPDGGRVSVVFGDVTLSAGLLIRAGFTLEAARNEAGSDATLTVAIDGDEVLSRREAKNGWTFEPSWVDTAARKGEKASISVEVFAEKEAFRDLCLDAFVLARAP